MPTKEIKQPQKLGIEGRIEILTYKAGTHDRMAPLVKKYLEARDKFPELAKVLKEKIRTMYKAFEIREPHVQKNLIMQSANHGMDLIIQRLCSSNTYSLNIAYGEIGTGTTAVALTDVALTTPTARVPVAVSQDSGYNEAILQFFFPDSSLANQTYTEFGTFVDGSASIGTGQLFNHALFVTPYTKSNGTDITTQVTFTISQ